jgi:hypothetical protein
MALGEAGVVGPDGPEPRPSAIGTFRSGTARITLTPGETITLDNFAGPVALDGTEPGQLRWTGPDGWSLTVTLFDLFGDQPEPGVPDGFAVVDHVAGHLHRTSGPMPPQCTVTFGRKDATGIEGSAKCLRLRWYDAVDVFGGQFGAGEPSPLPDPPFDLELTFSARP